MITVESLTKTYGSLKAVSDLSFSILPNELIGFIGPNGSGKTTTFKCLSTLIKPTSGRIVMDGLDLSTHLSEVRKKIGYLPEETPLLLDLTVEEYLRFRYSLKKSGSQGMSPNAVLNLSGLENVGKKILRNLSKGYKQRVGIAESLLGTPKVLFLDEPINGLDPDQIMHIRSLLVSLKSTHTLVVSSHILSELELTCDKYLIIAKGQMKAFGTLEELMKKSVTALTYRFEFFAPPSPEVFSGFKGVGGIKDLFLEGKVLSVITELEAKDPREDIQKRAFEKGFYLCGMEKKTKNLEEIYKDLTRE